MAITGIKSIHYRVADEAQLSRSREFFTQFGLAPRGHDAAGTPDPPPHKFRSTIGRTAHPRGS